MTNGQKKAQCKYCFHFLSEGSNTTLKNHITHPHCEVLKAQQNQNPHSSVASESAFSTSDRLLTIRRTRLTPESLEMCMYLKDHLDDQERKQDTSPLELPLDVEEGVFNVEVQQNEATELTDQEIALDASSDSSS
ncbi:zinc finger BED domain-containing protein RICESLEEPER 2 [Tanacetum coccineum]